MRPSPPHLKRITWIVLAFAVVLPASLSSAAGKPNPKQAPSNTVLPSISGTVQSGQTLTASSGTWSGASSYNYQWQRCDSNRRRLCQRRRRDRAVIRVGCGRCRLDDACRGDGDEQVRGFVGLVGADGTGRRSPERAAVRGSAVQHFAAGDHGLVAAGTDAVVEHGLLERDAAFELQLPVVPLRLGRQQLRGQCDRIDRSVGLGRRRSHHPGDRRGIELGRLGELDLSRHGGCDRRDGGTDERFAARDHGLVAAGPDALVEHGLLERDPALELQLPVVPAATRQATTALRPRPARPICWARPMSARRSA